ncbi:hypothetical protein D3C86_1573140 [compost metagenome]
MEGAAELTAEALMLAGLLDVEPALVDVAGDGVHGEAQGAHAPVVDDVGRRDQDLDDLVGRQHQVGVRDGDLVVGVLVLPEPLVADDLDGQVRLGRVLDVLHGLVGRDRDRNQDDRGDDGPDDLERGVAVDLLGLSALARAELHQDEGHGDPDPDEDHGGEPEDEVVDPVDPIGDRGRIDDATDGMSGESRQHGGQGAHPGDEITWQRPSNLHCLPPSKGRIRL